jgi:hypothetical protein
MLELVINDCTCFKCFEIVCLFVSDLSFFFVLNVSKCFRLYAMFFNSLALEK